MSYEDPFASAVKVPSVSWRDVQVGQTVTMVVSGPAKKVQSRDFETGQPAYWDEARTQPKYSAVVNGTVDGEDRAIWAQIPSALFAAIGKAQADAGAKIDAGGTLRIQRTEDKPNAKNPRLNPAKQFIAKYEPPKADPFGSSDDEIPF